MSMLSMEAGEQGEHTLKRSLGAVNLVTLGIGAVIGAGIFVLTGQAAALYAGPAVALSFVLAGITCAFAGLCYAEFASIIPIAGSAYTYGYATLGEFVAWIIGWDLVLEYAFGASTVASGWSGYFTSLLQQFGIQIPPQLTASTGTQLVLYQNQWGPVMSLPPGVSDAGLPHVTAAINLVAMAIVMLITVILVIGIKESANFNSGIVFIKLSVVAIFLVVGGYFLIRHPGLARTNWHPFVPPKDANGNFGWGGISKGASRIFFAYIGFDAVSTAAQEAKKPQRDMPIGILGSLAICTILYILVSLVLTGLVSYTRLNVGAPVALGIDATGVSWGALLVKIGAVFGLATVMLVMLLGQTRVLYSMANDGLLPKKFFAAVHPRFRTPWKNTILVGLLAAVVGSLTPIDDIGKMVNIGTLLAFVIVCIAVMVLRHTNPGQARPFRTPWVPVVPILGIGFNGYMMYKLGWINWARLIVWLLIGLVVYFTYSRKHSRVRQAKLAGNATHDPHKELSS